MTFGRFGNVSYRNEERVMFFLPLQRFSQIRELQIYRVTTQVVLLRSHCYRHSYELVFKKKRSPHFNKVF